VFVDYDFEYLENCGSTSIGPTEHGQIGATDFRQQSQSIWDKAVRAAVSSIETSEEDPGVDYPMDSVYHKLQGDYRPRVLDNASQNWILVDTGSVVTAWPKAWYPEAKLDNTRGLQAVNKSKIATYGRVTKEIRLGRKSFNMEVVIADIPKPIIGWDFLKKFRLNFEWAMDGSEEVELVDKVSGIRAPLRIEPVHIGTHLDLAPIEEPKSFLQWSQMQTQLYNDTNKPEEIQMKYKKLIDKFPELLNYSFKPGTAKHGVLHKIDTGDSAPCTAKVRPLMPGSPKEVQGKKNWMELVKLGIVERVGPQKCNFWTSALHLVPKPSGDLRVCGDFRMLNDKTLMDGYPLPNIRHFSAKIYGMTVFSRIDLTKAYHQVPLDQESQLKTVVVTPWGAYKFRKLAMGLKNSAQSFQRLMDSVLAGIENIFCYMDDILVFSKNEKEHFKTLETLFKRLEENGMAISLKKCEFGKPALDFLGYRVDAGGIKPLPRKLEAIAKYPEPTKAKQLLGFLGAVNYYRRTLPKIGGKHPAEIMQPLYQAATAKLSAAAFTKEWEEKELGIQFIKVKQMLMQACQLAHPDPNAPLSVTADASDYAMGGVLEQYHTVKGWQPLGFWSKHLKPSETKWTPFRRELYAVQQAMRHFGPETDGRHVMVHTDHKALIGAFKSTTSQQYDPIAMNHIQEIAQKTSDIRFLSGKANCVADLLSRPWNVPLGKDYQLPTPEEVAAVEVAFEMVDHKAMSKDQAKCKDTAAHREGKHPRNVKMMDIEFSPGTWLYCNVTDGIRSRPLVPVEWRDIIFKMFHGLHHPGQKATVDKVETRYYWPDLRKDVSAKVKQCKPCQETKSEKSIQPPLKKRLVDDPRFKDLQIDVVGPLPVSEGMRYLLTIHDRTTRWTEALPMAEANAETCSTAMQRGWIQRFGLPWVATSDNGNTFISNLWKEIQKELGVHISFTPPYHPSSLGGVERQHKDIKIGLKATLKAMGDEYGSSWMARLPWVMLGRRTAFQPALDATPAELVFGSTPTIPGDIIGEPGPTPDKPQIKRLLEGLRTNAARPAVQTTHNREHTENYPDLEKVTHVYVRKGKTTPLGPTFEGPFLITERQGTSCVQIRVGSYANGEPRFETQHWSNLKIAHRSEGEEDAVRKKLGRKLNPKAPEFKPGIDTSEKVMPDPVTIEKPDMGARKDETCTRSDNSAQTVSARPQRKKRRPMRFGGNCYD
jgi:transposase InsO family protein